MEHLEKDNLNNNVFSCVKSGEIFFHTEYVIILDSLLLRLPKVWLISTQQAYESVLIWSLCGCAAESTAAA